MENGDERPRVGIASRALAEPSGDARPKPAAQVGVGVMVFKDGKVLLSRRKSALGRGEYSFPGGHLEYMESFADCVRREVAEETGVAITNVRFLRVGNVKRYAPLHYVNVGFIADWERGEPQTLEPEKAEPWAWYDLDQLPSPLFEPTEGMIEAYRKNEPFNDA